MRFEPSWQWPKPVQRPRPPVLIGGAPGPTLFAHIAEYARRLAPDRRRRHPRGARPSCARALRGARPRPGARSRSSRWACFPTTRSSTTTARSASPRRCCASPPRRATRSCRCSTRYARYLVGRCPSRRSASCASRSRGARGPGGQNVNKVESKAVLRWDVARSPSLSGAVRARFLERFARRITVGRRARPREPALPRARAQRRRLHREAPRHARRGREAAEAAPGDEADARLEAAPPRRQESAVAEEVGAGTVVNW